jgi:hypothetical protein
MFAVKDKRSNKFLRDFTGSYSTFASNGNSPAHLYKGAKTHEEMWCLDSPNGAKLYRNRGGVRNSIGDEEWLEIVEVNTHMPLTKNEAAYIAAFLEELDDRFSNDGCNDMSITDIPENREMLIAAEKQWREDEEIDDDEEEEIIRSHRGKLDGNNQAVLHYLQKRLMDAFGISKDDLPST